MRKRFGFLEFRKVVRGEAEAPPELGSDPDFASIVQEAREGDFSLKDLLQLFLQILPLILKLLA